jgi:hypothetical protein
VDLQHLIQRPIERSAMATQLLPQLLLLLGVGEEGVAHRRALAPASGPPLDRSSQGGGVGRKGLGAVPRAPGHHVAIPPSDERPRLRLGGWCGKASPLVPPGRRGIVVRNLHRRRLGTAGESGLLRRRDDLHRWLRYRGCGLLLRRGDLRLRQRLSGRGRLSRLRSR